MKQQEILTLSIFTVITVFAWIAFDVYHAAVTSGKDEVEAELLAPLTPTLHTAEIEKYRL